MGTPHERLESRSTMKKEDLLILNSATKDSISLAWRHVDIFESMTSSSSSSSPLFPPSPPYLATMTSSLPSSSSSSTRRSKLTGYQITYQAAGSSLVQMSRPLPPGVTFHVISNLHESTIYDVCLVAHFTVDQPLPSASSSSSSSSPPPTPPSTPKPQYPSTGNTTISCLEASTVTESFAMMVGSTLGAFLALAIVVSIVYLAKRQRKHFTKYPPNHLDDSRMKEGGGRAPHGLEEALLRVGDNVFLQVYKQKMPRMRSEVDENLVDQPEVNAEEVMVCRGGKGSNSFVLVSLDEALELVGCREGVTFLEDDGGVIRIKDDDDDEEEEEEEEEEQEQEEFDMQILNYDFNQADSIRSPSLDPKTIVENAYRLKL